MQDWLETWPGFITDLVAYYTEEFCYYLILLHFTALDFAHSRWLLNDYKKTE